MLMAYGITAVIWPLFFVSYRYLTGRSHLFTAFNAILAGYVPFVGLSTIAFAKHSGAVQAAYATYSTEHVIKMIGSVVIFTITLIFAYDKARLPRGIHSFVSVPLRYTPRQPVVISTLAFLVALACMLPRFGLEVPVLSLVMAKSLVAATIFAALFAFSSWWRDRSDVLALTLFLGIFSSCIVLAVLTGGGRRALLGVILSLGLYAYWQATERIDRPKLWLRAAIFALVGFLFITAYNKVRHFDRSGQLSKERNVVNSINALAKVPGAILDLDFVDDQSISDIGQNATNCSLYSIVLSERMKNTNRSTQLKYPSYFHTVAFTLGNPVPRTFWKNKPNALGYMLPKQFSPRSIVSWGPGLAGHFYHEGGMLMALFYGLVIGVLTRWLDLLVITNSNNLLAIGLLGASVPHFVLLPRGDLGIVAVNMIFCIVVFLVIRFLALRLYSQAVARRYS